MRVERVRSLGILLIGRGKLRRWRARPSSEDCRSARASPPPSFLCLSQESSQAKSLGWKDSSAPQTRRCWIPVTSTGMRGERVPIPRNSSHRCADIEEMARSPQTRLRQRPCIPASLISCTCHRNPARPSPWAGKTLPRRRRGAALIPVTSTGMRVERVRSFGILLVGRGILMRWRACPSGEGYRNARASPPPHSRARHRNPARPSPWAEKTLPRRRRGAAGSL